MSLSLSTSVGRPASSRSSGVTATRPPCQSGAMSTSSTRLQTCSIGAAISVLAVPPMCAIGAFRFGVDATEHRRPGGRARLTELTGGALHRLHGPVQLAGIRRALWDGHRPESRGGQLQAEGGPPLPVEGGHKRVVAPADEPAPALERCLLYTSP